MKNRFWDVTVISDELVTVHRLTKARSDPQRSNTTHKDRQNNVQQSTRIKEKTRDDLKELKI